MTASRLATALVESLDDEGLELLAERLAPRLAPLLRGAVDAGDDRWLTAREAAAYLGLSVHALHKLSAAREIPFAQDAPGCKLWFRRSELDRWRAGPGGSQVCRSASSVLPPGREAAS